MFGQGIKISPARLSASSYFCSGRAQDPPGPGVAPPLEANAVQWSAKQWWNANSLDGHAHETLSRTDM